MSKGLFISVDGIDGGGKTTLVAELMCEIFKRFPDKEVTTIKTPGGTPFGRKIREMVLDPDSGISSKVRFLMFVADMLHITETIIKPEVEKGNIVISDRYMDSTKVYQIETNPDLSPYEKGLFEDLLERTLMVPDLTFIVDIPPSEAKRRIMSSRASLDKVFEDVPEYVWENRRNAFIDLAVCVNAAECRKMHVILGTVATGRNVDFMANEVAGLLNRVEGSCRYDRQAA